MPEGSEVAIDIAGGAGEYLTKRAANEPNKTFVVLDPAIKQIPDKPKNLYLVEWKSDAPSSLPFSPDSVSEVSINTLYREVRYPEDTGNIIEEPEEKSQEKYKKIIQDVKRVLSQGGKITVVEPQLFINEVRNILQETGFEISQDAKALQDPDRTEYTKVFHDIAVRKSKKGIPLEQSDSLPMEIIAVKPHSK